jgi:hypothetical protein
VGGGKVGHFVSFAGRGAQVVPDQNMKYRCASGNSFAGSQVSSTPSARTS